MRAGGVHRCPVSNAAVDEVRAVCHAVAREYGYDMSKLAGVLWGQVTDPIQQRLQKQFALAHKDESIRLS